MQRSIIAAVVAAALLTGWAMPSAAQQNGIVIQNNGVDSADSAAGADNVRISNISGNGQSLSEGGLNNESVRRRNAIARIEARGTTWTRLRPRNMWPRLRSMSRPRKATIRPTRTRDVEPVPVVEETVVDASTQQEQVLKLPSTGAGIGELDALGRGRGSGGLGAGSNDSEETSADIVHTGSIDEARGPVT